MATHSTILRLGGVMVAAAVAGALGGCSLRIQAPIREVAYDFSDRDFYDRSYAPSPHYAVSETPQAEAPRDPRKPQLRRGRVQVQVNVYGPPSRPPVEVLEDEGR